MEMIKCKKCKNDMPKLRLERFGYNYCISCSTETPKRGVAFNMGTGEDTWSETVIMNESEYKKYQNTIKEVNKLK